MTASPPTIYTSTTSETEDSLPTMRRQRRRSQFQARPYSMDLTLDNPAYLSSQPSSRPVSSASTLSSCRVCGPLSQYKCVVVGDAGVGKTSLLLRFVHGNFFSDHHRTDFDSFTVSMALGDEWMPCTMTLLDTAGDETFDRLRTLTYHDADVFIVCFSLADPNSYLNVRARWVPELREFKPKTPIILVGTQSDRRDRHTVQQLSTTHEATDIWNSIPPTPSSSSSTNTATSTPSSSLSTNTATSRHSIVPTNDSLTNASVKFQQHSISPLSQSQTSSFITCKEGKRLAAKVKARMYAECSALEGTGLDKIFYHVFMAAVVPKTEKRFWNRMKRIFAGL